MRKKVKWVHLYSAFSIWIFSKALSSDRFTPSGPEAYIQSSLYMLVLILPTPEEWKAEWTLAGKTVSTRPGIEPGTSGLGGRVLTTAPNPPLKCLNFNELFCVLYKLRVSVKFPPEIFFYSYRALAWDFKKKLFLNLGPRYYYWT